MLSNLNLMIKRLIAFLIFLNCAVSYGQTIKTDVLVIGGGPGGVAAAIQCARSKVKTILVEENDRLCPKLTGNRMTHAIPDGNRPGGIWGELRKHIIAHYQNKAGYDTLFYSPMFEPDTAIRIYTSIADTVKNLTMQLNTSFIKMVKDDDRWDVSLMHNGGTQTIKARVVVDATEGGLVMTAAGGSYKIEKGKNNDLNLYRTSISAGDYRPYTGKDTSVVKQYIVLTSAYFLPLKALLANNISNLVVTGVQWPETTSELRIAYLGADIRLGQAAGVTAAYCAFFKTTTTNLNVRMIQNELLDFKGDMLALQDIGLDPYWRAIQQVCATGLLRPTISMEYAPKAIFKPDAIVTTAEIKPAMLELYTRAFIWFNKEKPGAQFTIGNLLSFISELTLTDPDNLQKSIGKAWTEQFHFTSSFDLDRPINRREFAILANKYLNPFGRMVDLDGKVVN